MLGIANSRMKDFYDLWTLSRQFDFSGRILCDAIEATFSRRQTDIPREAPLALTTEFTEDAQKQVQWKAFVRKSNLDSSNISLSEIGNALRFLMPTANALVNNRKFVGH